MPDLRGLLDLSIAGNTGEMTRSEIDDFLAGYLQAQNALGELLAGRMAFDDFLQIAEAGGLKVDPYLDCVEFNFQPWVLLT